MPYVPVPKDLTKVKTKLAFNLTKRQLICFSLAGLVGLAALLAVGGIGYYVKIVRPKQQAEDDAEFEDDGYGEGFDPDEAYGEPEYLSEDDFDDKDSK